MRVLVGCEFSGVGREAFEARGHDAWSCDIREPVGGLKHLMGDIMEALDQSWDLVVLHPPCTALCVAGNRHYAGTLERRRALDWTVALWERALLAAPRVALENPKGVLSSWKPPTQYIHPWQFGHGEKKQTGLWLHGLPRLEPTRIVAGRESRILNMPDSKGREMRRSLSYPGIAEAMATQWSYGVAGLKIGHGVASALG